MDYYRVIPFTPPASIIRTNEPAQGMAVRDWVLGVECPVHCAVLASSLFEKMEQGERRSGVKKKENGIDDNTTAITTMKYGSTGLEYLFKFGSYGDGNGQLNNPHGITIDKEQNYLVVDSGINRISIFDKNERFICNKPFEKK